MKKLLNAVLALTLLAPVVTVAAGDNAYLQQMPLKQRVAHLRDLSRQARCDEYQAQQAQQGYIRRGYEAVKSAGTRAVNAVKSVGVAGIDAAKAAGTYGLNAAQTAKTYVAAEWAKAHGVKGVSYFAGKAFLSTSLIAGATYLAYKAIQLGYAKAKTLTKKSTKKIKKIAAGVKRAVKKA